MSYPIYNKEPFIRYPEFYKVLDTFFGTHVPATKRKKINDQVEILFEKEEKLKAAKGIIYALIFCIPFWILLVKVFL